MLALYAGFTAVVVNVFLIEQPEGPEKTPATPTAMQRVVTVRRSTSS